MGHPYRHGAKFDLHDPETWPDPTYEHRCETDDYGEGTGMVGAASEVPPDRKALRLRKGAGGQAHSNSGRGEPSCACSTSNLKLRGNPCGSHLSPARRGLPAMGIPRRTHLELSGLRQNRAASTLTSDFRQQTPGLNG